MKFIENIKKVVAAGVDLQQQKRKAGRNGAVWSCDVYLRERKLGDLRDAGRGGFLEINISPADQALLVRSLKAAQYPFDSNIGSIVLDPPADDRAYIELILPCIADLLESLAQVKRKAETMTLIHLKCCSESEYEVISHPYSPELGSDIRKRYGDNLNLILNEAIAAL